MSKFKVDPDFKILKSCPPAEIPPKVSDDLLCPPLTVVKSQNFLENIDQDILFVDESIEVEVEEPPKAEVVREEEKQEKFSPNRQTFKLEAPGCFDSPPTDLRLQIALPLQDLESLFFYEVFMISKKPDKDLFLLQEKDLRLIPRPENIDEIGFACVTAESLDDGKILVYVSIQFMDEGEHVTQETLSVVKDNLQTVHEKSVLRTYVGGCLTERTLHIFTDDNSGGFRMIKTETKDGETDQWKGRVEWTQPGDYLSGGANVLLTRRLVQNRFSGCIQSWNCDINGVFSLSQHWFQEPETTLVIDKYLEVQRVNRLLISHDGNVSRHSSYCLSGNGCLLKEVYSKTPFRIHINPYSDVPPINRIKDLHLNWESDLQLLSMYLEFKEKRKDELKKHLEQPRMQNILRDYILCLFKSKPKSVMNFTVDFVRKLERDGNVQVYQTADRRHQHNSL